jgi:hypothetical protein
LAQNDLLLLPQEHKLKLLLLQWRRLLLLL